MLRSPGRRDFFLKALGKISGRGVRGSDWYFQAWQTDETVMRLSADRAVGERLHLHFIPSEGLS